MATMGDSQALGEIFKGSKEGREVTVTTSSTGTEPVGVADADVSSRGKGLTVI